MNENYKIVKLRRPIELEEAAEELNVTIEYKKTTELANASDKTTQKDTVILNSYSTMNLSFYTQSQEVQRRK